MKCCKNCKVRYVGCHSQCQLYVVQKVIHDYKRDKRIKDYQATIIDKPSYKECSANLRLQLSGYKR